MTSSASVPLPGTIGLVQTNDLAGFIIRLDTQDRWNHVVLAGYTGSLYEANPIGGYQKVPASKYVQGTELVWLDREPLSNRQRLARVVSAEARLGLPYNWLAIAAIALKSIPLLHLRFRWLNRWATGRNHLMCSEAVAEIARESSSAWFPPDVLTSTLTPGDIDFSFRRRGI